MPCLYSMVKAAHFASAPLFTSSSSVGSAEISIISLKNIQTYCHF